MSGSDSLTKYQFGTFTASHMACKVCGVNMFNFLPEDAPFAPVNVRTIEGLDFYRISRGPQEVTIPLPDGTTVTRVLGDGSREKD